ncbi:MAG: tripartite tricarboxylate transporter permease [Candidatus Njordarchaeum guaymaensis]|mgnify:CR=1 FL=1
MADPIILLTYILLGVIIGSALSIIPSLHVYNVAPIFILLAPTLGISDTYLVFFLLGNVIGYSMLNMISTFYFSAPDDTTFMVLMPSQVMLRDGRGIEAVLLGGLGALIVALIFAVISPILLIVIPPLISIIIPNMHWLIALIMFYMLLSEFPKDVGVGKSRWKRFKAGWRNLAAGYLTFILAGILGFIVMFGNILPAEVAYQGLMPAFIGFFAVPSLIMNFFASPNIPEQRIVKSLDATPIDVFKGSFAGFLGGSFAATAPAITGGMGAIIVGQAIGQREESQFIISMGANRFAYYVGSFFLLFVPGVRVVRGGMANLAAMVYIPGKYMEFYVAAAGIAIGGCIAFIILVLTAIGIGKWLPKIRYDILSGVIMVFIIALVYFLTGIIGLGIMIVATGIGLLPVLYNSRRLHCLSAILLPLTLSMTGLADDFAAILGVKI